MTLRRRTLDMLQTKCTAKEGHGSRARALLLMQQPMENITKICEEVHAFAGTAERTGQTMDLRGLKAGKRKCTSLRDLVRKYRLYGDGFYYVPAGHWPENVRSVDLDNVKWMGVSTTLVTERGSRLTRPEAREHRERLLELDGDSYES